jgi:hypothetical protein
MACRVLREANRGIIRSCADDIGVSLARLKHLGLLTPIFGDAETLAGLKLKPPKCVLVPLCKFSDRRAEDISKWMRRNIPQRAHFAVQDCTKLLGFYIGPGAGRKNWTEQVSKLKARVQFIQSTNASVKLNAYTYNSRVVPICSYVAQLLPYPKYLEQIERAHMHTILRLPQNALCHADFFHLHLAGGPRIRSIIASCVAALIRTSSRTLTTWPSWISQLEVAAWEHLPLRPLVHLQLTTSSWDSPPIACNLRDASLGLPNDDRWFAGASLAVRILQVSDSTRSSIQKVFYCKLIESRFSNTLHDTVERRLNTLFCPFVVDCKNQVNLERCFGVLKDCKVADAIKVIKCWVNGWATSHRYHEDKVLPCLFGCSGCVDSLSHYLQCPPLLALWRFLTRGNTSEDPLIRWGLIQPNKVTFLYISCIFSGYHAVRRDLREFPVFLEFNQIVFDSAQLRRAWSVFADAFKVEARELALAHRQFSLPEFLISIT